MSSDKDGRVTASRYESFPISTEMRECPAKDLSSETFEMEVVADAVDADVSNPCQFGSTVHYWDKPANLGFCLD